MPRFALLLAYDGADFAGFWRQPGARTVGAELDAALLRLGERAAPEPAARTDAGVHARGQVAHVDLARSWDPAELHSALDHQLPSDCACLAAAAVSADWHAAQDPVTKTYRYDLEVSPQRDPLRARRCWRPPGPIDHLALETCAKLLRGEHDFSGFARRGDHREDHRCRLESLRWEDTGDLLRCSVIANRFTYRLVRSLVGAMVAVANGNCTASDLALSIAGEDTAAGHQQAPAHGLTLIAVRYPSTPSWTP